ncbi:MAG: MFS transporter, partial [Phycisphaerae bacterium]
PFGVIGILMFTAPNLTGMQKIIYAFITYNLMMIIYTVNNVPYCALTGVLTGDNIERTGLASYRFIFAMLATLAVQSLSIPLVNYLGVDNKTIVQSSVTAEQLTINPSTPGLAKIIIAADDNQGNVLKKDFYVKVTKPVAEIPLVKQPLSDLTFEQGFGSYEIELSPVFDAGAYGPVSFSTSMDNRTVARTEIIGDKLRITESGIGIVKITVSARDRLRNNANSTFTLAILSTGNTVPQVISIPEVDLNHGFGTHQLNLNDIIVDKDGDTLSYRVSNSDTGVLNAEIRGGQLILTERKTGYAEVTVTADDNKGGRCSIVIPVIIRSDENMSPILTASLPSQTVASESKPISISLNDYFSDPDDDKLTYEVSVVNQAKGYQLTMGIFCTLAILFFVITFFTTRERVTPDPKQKTSLKQDLSDLMHNQQWVAIFFLTVFIFVYLALRGSVTLYYFTYYVKRADLFSYFNALGMGVTLLGILFSKPLAVRFGKRNTFRTCLFLTAVFACVYAFLPPDAIFLIFAFNVLLSLCYAPTIPMLWAMMADVADYGEWKTGRRATGMTFSATTFGLKMGLSLGGALSGWLLGYFGYVAGVDQTEFALRGLRLMMSVIPAIPFFIGVAVLFLYKIDKQTEIQMQDDLIERRKTYQIDNVSTEGV